MNFPPTCYCQFATFRFPIPCVLPVLHALQFAVPSFLALKRSFTGISYYFTLYRGHNRPGNMLSYPKSCCGSIATFPGSLFQLLPVYLCVQTNYTCTRFTSRIPISSTLDPHNFFFFSVVLHHLFGKVLDIYIYIISPKFAPKLHSHKKVNFLRTPPSLKGKGIPIPTSPWYLVPGHQIPNLSKRYILNLIHSYNIIYIIYYTLYIILYIIM